MSYELGVMPEQAGAQITYNSTLITPDLILSDLMMPVMDGLQLLEKLKSSDATRHIPVIMLTARAEARDKLKALRIGVDDYMTKPFEEEELLARIKNLLRNQSARKQEAPPAPASETARPQVSQEDQQWLEGFEAYVQKHLSSDTLTVSALAGTFAMSDSTLQRQLKRLTGLSPIQYLQEMRLDEGRKLLETRRYNSIGQVAAQVGFQDARSFSRSYKQRFGKLPSELMGE
jgi:DNA-binding response OmpR family regulator